MGTEEKTTGWLIQKKLGAEGWYVIEVPGGYRPGAPFPEDAVWHEHPSKDAALEFLHTRVGGPSEHGRL